jgi:ribosomal protein S18 acetylase RimI-like enzyme
MGHDLMSLVMETAEELGFLRKDPETQELVATGEGGTKGYLKWIGINRPDRFVALIARVAPKHVFADVTHRNAAMTSAEIEAELRERGLPAELLEHLLNAPEELDWDEDPDPYNLMKDVTPEKAPDDTAG